MEKQKKFKKFIEDHTAIISKICRVYTDGQEEFEDYFQEVTLQLWRSYDSFRGDAKLSTWVYRIALNVCLSQIRKKKRNIQTTTLENIQVETSNDDHEELESLTKNIPHLKRARFWMTFSQEYITHLRVLENVGMTRIDPILYEGKEIVPLQFLKAVLPEPSSLGEGYSGKTSIGCQIKGIKDGQDKTYYVYNNCDHGYEEIAS